MESASRSMHSHDSAKFRQSAMRGRLPNDELRRPAWGERWDGLKIDGWTGGLSEANKTGCVMGAFVDTRQWGCGFRV